MERSSARKYVLSAKEGNQFQLGRNLFQAGAVLLFAAVGAIVGYFATNDRPDMAALFGGVLGMTVGTFLSGFVLMLRPPPPAMLTLAEIQQEYRRSKRRLTIAAIALAAFLLTMPLVIWRFADADSDLSVPVCVFWIVATCGLCVYVRGLSHECRTWTCPNCGKPLEDEPSRCVHCGLSIDNITDQST
jgi:hypothetical protein